MSPHVKIPKYLNLFLSRSRIRVFLPELDLKAMHFLSHFPLLMPGISIIAATVIPYFGTINPLLSEPDANLAQLNKSINITTISRLSLTNLSDRISFRDVVYDGVRLTKSRYPGAIFREVQAASVIGPTTDPHYLTDIRLIFSLTQGNYRSIYLEMSPTWPQWGEPRLTTIVPREEDGVLPSMYGMDIVEADRRMKAAGFGQRYDVVDVRWPGSLPEESQQAFYFFEMHGGGLDFVTVGARDGRVTPFYDIANRLETE